MVLVAYILGAVFSVIEKGWSVHESFLYLISAMTGLGNPLTNETPSSPAGKLVAIIAALWQLSIGGTIIGLTGAIPLATWAIDAIEHRIAQAVFKIDNPSESERILPMVVTLLLSALLLVPCGLLIVAVIAGVLIAIVEGWGAGNGFFYFSGNMAGVGNPLVNLSPTTVVGETVDIVISLWVIVLGGAAIGVIANHRLVAMLQDLLDLTGCKGLAVMFVAVPVLVNAAAFLIGALLALLEDGWSPATGYYYMISALCGLGIPLTNATPATNPGKVVAVVCASWQMGLSGTVLGLAAGAPILGRARERLEGTVALVYRRGSVRRDH
jgi:hypothetical protein